VLQFNPINANTIAVLLENKRVGEIRTVEGGFQYFPKGQRKGGEVFPSLAACKQSLADE